MAPSPAEALRMLKISLPLVQAPMAGVTNPSLAAAVSNSGGLGSIAVGAVDVTKAQAMIKELKQKTAGPFNVNVFCNATPKRDFAKEESWLRALNPTLRQQGAEALAELVPPYKSFLEDSRILGVLLEERPPIVSFHFGLPPPEAMQRLQNAGIKVLVTATNLEEAQSIEAAGADGIVAQGYEAGGHRGMFDPDAVDTKLGTLPLTRLLVCKTNLPIIAAGGIMDGAGIAACLALGAAAAQLGTAFVSCPESSATEAHRKALLGLPAQQTAMTRVFSGRPARALPNRFTALGLQEVDAPDYPVAYHAVKALSGAPGSSEFGAQWAGQGAPLARVLPAAELVQVLKAELKALGCKYG